MSEIAEVYRQLAGKVMAPQSDRAAILFSMVADPTEGEILLALPGTAADIAAKFDLEEAAAEEKLQWLFTKGLVFKSKKPEGTKYRLCRDIIQFHDATILWPDAPKELLDLWKDFMDEEWPEMSKFVEGFFPKPFSRVIPINQSISAQSQVLASESCKDIIESSSRLALTRCACRVAAGKCDAPLDVCLQLGRAADYTIERGTGREITREEALEVIRLSEEQGLVHVTMNKAENMHYICNCCDDCCVTLPVMIKYGRKLTDPSRFLAAVEADDCNGCGTCADRCYFGAIEVGEDGYSVVDAEKCLGCGVCQPTCPTEAIQLIEVREKEFIPQQ